MTSSDAPAGQYELSPRKSSFEYGANAIEHAGITGGTTLEDKGMNNESFEGLSKDAMKKLERKCESPSPQSPEASDSNAA